MIQVFDTEKKQFVSQSFTAGDQVEYETTDGSIADDDEMAKAGFGPLAEKEPYLNFDMVQPIIKGEHIFNSDTGRCIRCNCDEDEAFVGGQACIDAENEGGN